MFSVFIPSTLRRMVGISIHNPFSLHIRVLVSTRAKFSSHKYVAVSPGKFPVIITAQLAGHFRLGHWATVEKGLE